MRIVGNGAIEAPSEIVALKAENEALKAENTALKEAKESATAAPPAEDGKKK